MDPDHAHSSRAGNVGNSGTGISRVRGGGRTIVEFEHEEGLRAWRRNPEHIAAQKLAREKYYTEYHVQVCTLDRESQFKADEAAVPAARSVG
jgi:heme-degrading monooxygenase HmoA